MKKKPLPEFDIESFIADKLSIFDMMFTERNSDLDEITRKKIKMFIAESIVAAIERALTEVI